MVAAANVVGPKSNGQEAPVPRPDAFQSSRIMFCPLGQCSSEVESEVPNEVDEEPYVEEDDEA